MPSSLSSPVRESVRHQLPQKPRSYFTSSSPAHIAPHFSTFDARKALSSQSNHRNSLQLAFVSHFSSCSSARIRKTASVAHQLTLVTLIPPNMLIASRLARLFRPSSRLQYYCSGNSAGAALRPHLSVGTPQQVSNPIRAAAESSRLRRPRGDSDVAAAAILTAAAITLSPELDVTQASLLPYVGRLQELSASFHVSFQQTHEH